jgi:hypothetical protein
VLFPPLRALGKLPRLLLLLLVPLPTILAHQNAFPAIAGESPPRAAGRHRGLAVSPPASLAEHLVRSISDGQSRSKGLVPLGSVHGGQMDQVHRDGPRSCISFASAPASHSPPRGTPSASPPATQAFLQKEPYSFQNYINALPPSKNHYNHYI